MSFNYPGLRSTERSGTVSHPSPDLPAFSSVPSTCSFSFLVNVTSSVVSTHFV